TKRPGRLGVAGQEALGPVVGGVDELGAERPEREDEDDPDEDDQPLRPAPGDDPRQRSHIAVSNAMRERTPWSNVGQATPSDGWYPVAVMGPVSEYLAHRCSRARSASSGSRRIGQIPTCTWSAARC